MPRDSSITNTTAPWARSLSFRAELRDGSAVRIRPITPADKAKMAAAFGTMSPETRFQRFQSVRTALSESELRALTELDYDQHVAWGALADDEPGRPGVAAARFLRDPEHPDTALFAITVVDAWQRRGLGTLLLRTLLVSAAERDLRSLVAAVLPNNTAALQLSRRFGGRMYRYSTEAITVEIPVRRAERADRISQQILVPRPPDGPEAD